MDHGIDAIHRFFEGSYVQYVAIHPFNFVENGGRDEEREPMAAADSPYGIPAVYQFLYNIRTEKTGPPCDEYFQSDGLKVDQLKSICEGNLYW
jgi:hypothetical protein